jgi:GcrA cell cycle regulator
MILWTEDRLTQLRDLWARGFTATQISLRMENVTRNAVIGALYRHGVGGRVQKKRRPTHKDTVRRIVAKALAPTIPVRSTVQPPTTPVPFVDLGPGECRFPLWGSEPSTRLSPACGCPTLLGEPYCAEHWKVTHVR